MGEAANCSYVDSGSGGSAVQGCPDGQAFCCAVDGVSSCSSVACGSSSQDSTSEIDKLLFWVILAALAGLLCIVLFVVYLVCRFRKHKFDYLDGKRDSIFEETVCEAEIRTITKPDKAGGGAGRTTVQVQEAALERRVVQVTPRPSRLPVRPATVQGCGTPRLPPGPPRDGGGSPAWSRTSNLVRQQQHLTQESLRPGGAPGASSQRASPSWSRVSAVVHQREGRARGQGRQAGSSSPGWSRLSSLARSRAGDGSPTSLGTPRSSRKVSPQGVLPDVQ